MPVALPALLRRFAGPKQRRRSHYETCRSESLETRILPAAVVAASRSTLNVTGDADASDLQIEQISGGVRVTALTGTIRVNGVDVASADFTGITSLNVRLGEGDDSVSVLGALNLKNVSINLGDGDNTLDIGAGMNVTGKLAVTGGTGADLVSLTGSVGKSATFNLGLGNDELSLLGTSFSSTVSINTSAGADVITIDESLAGVDASFGNNLTINTGEDADTVSISNATTKKVSLNTGDDADIVTLDTVTAGGTLSLQTGAGDDDLTLRTVVQTQNGSNVVNVGTGADDVVIETSSFQGNVSIELGTGIVNTLRIDDTSFLGTFTLNANGTAVAGVGDLIDIETNTSLTGSTVFSKAVKVKVGSSADIDLGVLDVASDTRFLSSVSVTGINPAADLQVALLNTSFFSAPKLSKVNSNLV